MRAGKLASRLVAFASLLVVALAVGAGPVSDLRTGSFNPPRLAPEFRLVGSDGSPLELARYRGKVVAIGFGYTHCADVCPTTLFMLAQARKTLGAAAKDFQVIYVTVDPERDTAPRLHEFLTAYDPTFIGGSGSREALAAVQKAYGIEVSIQPPQNGDPSVYTVHHSSFVYLVDRDGNLRTMMPFGVTVEDVVHDIKVLLAR